MNKFLKVGFLLNCLLMFSFVLNAQNISFIGNTKESKVFNFNYNAQKTQYEIKVNGTIRDIILLRDTLTLKSSNKKAKCNLLNEIISSVNNDKELKDSILKKIRVKKEFSIEITPAAGSVKRTLIQLEKQKIYLESESSEVDQYAYSDSVGDKKISDGNYRRVSNNDNLEIIISEGKIKKMEQITPPPPVPKQTNFILILSFFLNVILIIVVLLFVFGRNKLPSIRYKKKIAEIENKYDGIQQHKPKNDDPDNIKTIVIDEVSEKLLSEIKNEINVKNNESILLELKKINSYFSKYKKLINECNFNETDSIKEQINTHINNKIESERKRIIKKYRINEKDANDWDKCIKLIIANETVTINDEKIKLASDVSSMSDEISKLEGELNKEKSELQVQRNNYSSLMNEKNGLEEMNKQTSLAAKKINEFFIEYQRELNRDNLKEEEKPQIALLQLSKIGLHAISLARVIEKKNTKEDDLNLKLLLGENPSFLSKTSVDSTPNENDAITRSIILLLKQNHIRSLEGVYVKGKKISD